MAYSQQGAGPRKPPKKRANPRGANSQGGQPDEGVVTPFEAWWQENKQAVLDQYGPKVTNQRARKLARAAFRLRGLLPPVEVAIEEEPIDDLLEEPPPPVGPLTQGQSFIGGFDVEELNQFPLGDVVSQMLNARANKQLAMGDYFDSAEILGEGEE